MKKTLVTWAALMFMAGSAFACMQQPEKKEAPEATEQTAPAPEKEQKDSKCEQPASQPDSTSESAGKECTNDDAAKDAETPSPASDTAEPSAK